MILKRILADKKFITGLMIGVTTLLVGSVIALHVNYRELNENHLAIERVREIMIQIDRIYFLTSAHAMDNICDNSLEFKLTNSMKTLLANWETAIDSLPSNANFIMLEQFYRGYLKLLGTENGRINRTKYLETKWSDLLGDTIYPLERLIEVKHQVGERLSKRSYALTVLTAILGAVQCLLTIMGRPFRS